MKYGYLRPVEINDTCTVQRQKIQNYTDKLLEEKHAEAKKRIVLDELLHTTLKPNDTLYVTDLCILADSTRQLLDILDLLEKQHISLYVINLDQSLTGNTHQNFHTHLKYLTQFQSDVVKFRTRLGIEKYVREGKSPGRPKRNDQNLKDAIEMYMSKKYTLDEIKAKTNISRATLYRHLDR